MADNTLNLDEVIKSDVFIKKLDETIAKIKELQSTIKVSNDMKLTIKGLQDFATSKTSGKDYEKFINETLPKATELQEKLNKLYKIENETQNQIKERRKEITAAFKNHEREKNEAIKQEIKNERMLQDLKEKERKASEKALEKQLKEEEKLLKLQQKQAEQKQKEQDAESKRQQKLLDIEIKKQEKIVNKVKNEAEKQYQKEKRLTEIINMQVKSIDDLMLKNNALVKVRSRLDLTTDAGRKEYEKLTKQIAVNTEQLKQYDAEIGRHQRHVGNYERALSGLNTAFAKITLIGGAVIGFFKGIGSAISGIMAFEKQVSNLSAITGITGGSLKQLSNEAINMSREYGIAAVGVVEAMKLIVGNNPKLAQNAEGLKEVTRQALLLSQASGLDVPEAAKRLTDALNQFNLPAEKAGEAVDILAAGAKFGAAEIPDITDALLQFGTVAKNSNIDLTQSVALIELLGEKGKKGSDAGVGLRNIITIMDAIKASSTESQFALKNAGVNMDIVADTSRPLTERLRELAKIQNDATAKVKVFGKENLTVGSIMLENIPRFEELSKQVATTGSAMEQAKINTDNLAGDLAVMGTAWDKLILSLNSGNGVISSIARGFVQLTTAVIDFFSNIKDNSELLTEQKETLNILVGQLRLYWDDSEKRKKIIDEINKQYPEFLANMDMEKIKMTDVNKRLDEYNKLQSKRINEALVEEETARVEKKIESYVKLNDELMKNNGRLNAQIYNQKKIIEEDGKLYRETGKMTERYANAQAAISNFNESIATNNAKIKENEASIKKLQSGLENTTESLTGLTKTERTFANTVSQSIVIKQKNKEQDDKIASESKKSIENEAKEREKALKKLESLERLKLELLKDSREKDLENQRLINEQRMKEFAGMPDATPILQDLNRAKIEEINKKWDEIELTNMYEIERAKAEILENNTELLFSIQLDYEKRKLALMEDGSKEAQLQQAKIDKLQKDNYEKSFFGQYDALKKNFENQRTFAEIEIQDAEELSKKKLEIALEEAKAKLELFKKIAAADGVITDTEKQNLEDLSDEIDKFQDKLDEGVLSEKVIKNTGKMFEDALNGNVDAFIEYKETVINGLDEQVSASDNNLQKAIDNLQKQKDLRAEGLASDVAGAEETVRIEQEKNEKLRTEREKQIKQQQTAAKIQIALQSAEQVSNLVTSSSNIFEVYSKIPGGTPIAIGLIALMISSFIAQKALALKAVNQGGNQKFEKGGWIEGNSHKQGGVNIEAEGGEFIISKKYASQNAELLEAINSGKLINPLKNTNIVTVNNDFQDIVKEQKNTNINIKKLLYLQRKSRFLTKNGYMDIEGNKTNFI